MPVDGPRAKAIDLWRLDARRSDPKDSEYALYAFGIAHTYLNVGPLRETRAGINLTAFDKDALHSVKRRFSGGFMDIMKSVYHGAIKIPSKTILVVLRKSSRRVSLLGDGQQRTVGQAHVINTSGGRQIETHAEIDDSADDRRCGDSGWSSGAASKLSRKIKATKGIRFPEINAMPKPIIFVGTRGETVPCKDSLGHGCIAPVVAEHKCRA